MARRNELDFSELPDLRAWLEQSGWSISDQDHAIGRVLMAYRPPRRYPFMVFEDEGSCHVGPKDMAILMSFKRRHRTAARQSSSDLYANN